MPVTQCMMMLYMIAFANRRGVVTIYMIMVIVSKITLNVGFELSETQLLLKKYLHGAIKKCSKRLRP